MTNLRTRPKAWIFLHKTDRLSEQGMPIKENKKSRMRPSNARIIAAVFLILGIAIGFLDFPQYFEKITGYRLPFDKFSYHLGLDIQGGTHLVYKADVQNIESSEVDVSMDALREVVERRVNLFGVAEPLVQVEEAGDEHRLIVELAGIKDINAAIRLIGETPFLEFREMGEGSSEEGIQFVPTVLTGRYVKRAEVLFDQNTQRPYIGLEFTEEGGKIFAEITRKNIGKPLAIFLDGSLRSAPVVQDEIDSGRAQITGNFTPEEVKKLVGDLNLGALPVPITLIAQQSIGPSLGQESLDKSIYAGILGFLAVAIFMIVWYRLPGVLAVLALIFYAALVLAIFKSIPVTLTIAGIAGFILSIGMAVDANILIFERLKEELRQGRSTEEAIHEGFSRAWTSIRDSNISSLITSVILYWLGTSIVKGFALTLGIGILVSMFSAIFVTRTLLISTMTRKLSNLRFIFMSGISK